MKDPIRFPNPPRPAEEEDLRRLLFSPPEAADEELCRSIMRGVARTGIAPALAWHARTGFLTLIAAGAVAAVFTVILWSLSAPAGKPETPASGPTEAIPDPPPVAEPDDPYQMLSRALVQQELLQHDARKLAKHLRENVILFRQ